MQGVLRDTPRWSSIVNNCDRVRLEGRKLPGSSGCSRPSLFPSNSEKKTPLIVNTIQRDKTVIDCWASPIFVCVDGPVETTSILLAWEDLFCAIRKTAV